MLVIVFLISQVILVGGTASIPRIQQMLKDYFTGKEICRRINPDEVIAYGAAIQVFNTQTKL